MFDYCWVWLLKFTFFLDNLEEYGWYCFRHVGVHTPWLFFLRLNIAIWVKYVANQDVLCSVRCHVFVVMFYFSDLSLSCYRALLMFVEYVVGIETRLFSDISDLSQCYILLPICCWEGLYFFNGYICNCILLFSLVRSLVSFF